MKKLLFLFSALLINAFVDTVAQNSLNEGELDKMHLLQP